MNVRRAASIGAVACLALLGSAGIAASAASGPHTKITTPAGPVFRFKFVGGSSNAFTVEGTASTGITSVDVYCYADNIGAVDPVQMVTNVPVASDGSFAGTASFSNNLQGPCRLRALPSGTDPTGYVSSFAGPIVFSHGIESLVANGRMYGYQAASEGNDGVVILSDAGQEGVQALLSVVPPAQQLGPLSNEGDFALRYGNITTSGQSTASAVRVDGHNAYLPFGVQDFLRLQQGLAVGQTTEHLKQTYDANGDATFTETAPLVRCSGDNTYPPTTTSCPSVEPTGVTFMRVSHFFRDGHQVSVRDSFVDADGAKHTVAAQYLAAVQPPTTGGTGYIFPTHGTRFRASHPSEQLTGFGTGAKSVLERYDMFASADDPAVDTSAVTWSRPPSSVLFDNSGAFTYGMSYTVHVAANGRGYLGFAVSERLATADVTPLARQAQQDMMNAPTSPLRRTARP